jgi:hypothetical protein
VIVHFLFCFFFFFFFSQQVVNEGLRPTIPPNCDASYAQLMQACWATNPELRPSFGFVLDALHMMTGTDIKR